MMQQAGKAESQIKAVIEAWADAARRPHSRLEIIDGGHVVHVDNPDGFTNAVRRFLQSL